jgi:hypothetical protein
MYLFEKGVGYADRNDRRISEAGLILGYGVSKNPGSEQDTGSVIRTRIQGQ